MRHRKSGRKLGRNPSHRKAMFRNLVTSMIEEEQIVTTISKAKEMRPMVEKLVTLAKNNIDGKVDAADRVEDPVKCIAHTLESNGLGLIEGI